MKIIIGSDHRGYACKEHIKKHFSDIGWIDVGTTNGDDRVDYPLIARDVCRIILSGEVERGILLCGSGVGISIAANRYPYIYAALCWSPEVARAAREHDCANVLVLPADYITPPQGEKIVQAWLETQFLGGQYEKRLELLETFPRAGEGDVV